MDHYEGDNIGGIVKLEIAFHTDFEGWNPILLAVGKNWINIPFTEQTANLSLAAEDTDNGVLYSYGGKFFMHRLRADVSDVLLPFIGQVGIIRLTDMNDEVYIIGTPGYPVALKYLANTGTRVTNVNGAGFEFSVDQPFSYGKT